MKNKLFIIILFLLFSLVASPTVTIAENSASSSTVESSEVVYNTNSAKQVKLQEFQSELMNDWMRRDIGNIKTFDVEFEKIQLQIVNPIQFLQEEELFTTSDIQANDYPHEYKKSPAIFIDENKDFRKYPGSGTELDPYLITGLEISHAKKNLIQIQNTDVYFEISHNLLHGQDGGNINIILKNVQHATIVDNFISNNNYGIMVSNSQDVNIVDNDVFNIVNDGAYFYQSSLVSFSANNVTLNANGASFVQSTLSSISSNLIYENSYYGLTLSSSTDSTVEFNSIYSNGYDGIFFEDSHNNKIFGNQLYLNGFASTSTTAVDLYDNKFTIDAGTFGSGIYLDPSMNNEVSNNQVFDNAGMGIVLELSSGTSISNNDVFSNDLTGIFFIDSDSNTITGNQVHDNGDNQLLSSFELNSKEQFIMAGTFGSGIYLDPSNYNTISDNDVFNNQGMGILLEYSTNTEITNNQVHQNGESGIFFIDSDYNAIIGNEVFSNGATFEGSNSLDELSVNAFDPIVFAGTFGSGIYLDPSHYNEVYDNNIYDNSGSGVHLLSSTQTSVTANSISGNGGDGVFLLNSSHNSISENTVNNNGYTFSTYSMQTLSSLYPDEMRTLAGTFGSGIYLDPSNFNNVTDNLIFDNAASGLYLLDSSDSTLSWNTIHDNNAHGVFLQNSHRNDISYNVVEFNGQTTSSVLGMDAGTFGSGIYLDPSHYNTVILNNVTSNAEHGLFIDESSYTNVDENRFLSNYLYGLNIDANSSFSYSTNNNFKDNDGVSAQARDDGVENSFAYNFWDGHDNNDTDYDGIADEPYLLDGDANNADSLASNIPNGLNFYNVTMESSPRKINADSEGTPLTLKVYLNDGFRVLNVSLDKLWLNGTINPYDYHIIDILTFTVTFDRLEINKLLNAVPHDSVPFFATLELTGRINDGLLDITGYDTVEVNQDDGSLNTLLIVGSIGILPASGISIRRKMKN